MSGNPVSIQHQGYARLLSENTLQGTGTHRTSGRQAQTLQAYRTSMREDGAELRLVRRACSRLHLDQIRPHGLGFTFICGRSRRGFFALKRKSRDDRMRAKLKEIKEEMRRRRHQP